MSRIWPLLTVALGGTIGALTRWGLLSLAATNRETLVIFGLNVFGSALLGAAIGNRERLNDDQFNLIGSGFAGGLTTFSTYSVSIARSLEDGALLDATVNGVGTLLAAVFAGGVGFRASRLAGSRRIRKLDRARRRAR